MIDLNSDNYYQEFQPVEVAANSQDSYREHTAEVDNSNSMMDKVKDVFTGRHTDTHTETIKDKDSGPHGNSEKTVVKESKTVS